MNDDAAALAATIGGRVRHERQDRRWTLDQLAEAAGLSRRMVVNVEQGSANPSVGTLLRLSDALGIGLPALVQPPERALVTVTRSGEGAALWTSPNGGCAVLVAGTRPPDVLELWDWTLAPGDAHTSAAHAAGTHELLHVLEGEVVMEIDGATHILTTGDAAGFAGDVPHAYRNESVIPARFSLAVLEPGVGTTAIGRPR
ncbi:helix-turn-helix domain-containing protein [Ornithinimicrobium sp. LYQ121]|uniref:helix-turn-helix domain-containing protein n=1 Tax=Ornithinimicrobium sp. LYQ121 TaxID=3378801 RepID=UPI003851CD5D